MATMLDRGDSYKVQYLGCAMLSQMATGLGLIQKPIRDLYFQHRKASMRIPNPLQERHLMMTDRGMMMTYPDGQLDAREEFFVMPSILFWDAVQFITVKGHDKKIRAAFEPLDNDHSRNKDNLFSMLDKQYHFLHGQRHPPLFTCVLRRTQGVKALDVHAFVCYSDEEALGLVRALNTVHSSYSSGEQQETGVFGYNPFGKESVRSTAGIQRAFTQQKQAGVDVSVKDDQRHNHEDPHVQHQFILRRPGESVREVQPRGNATPSPASVRDKTRAKSPGRSHSRDRSRYTGSHPNLSAASKPVSANPRASAQTQQPPFDSNSAGKPGDRNSRVFLLAQSDFQLNQLGHDEPQLTEISGQEDASPTQPHRASKSSRHVPETYDYLQTINRTLERAKDNGYKRKSVKNSDRATTENNSSSVVDNDPQNNGVNFGGQGIFQEDPNFGRGSTRSLKNMGQGYSLMSGSQGPPPGYAPHQSSRQPYAPSPTHTEERSPSPTYQSTIPRNRDKQRTSNSSGLSRNPSVAQAYDNINRFIAEKAVGSQEHTPSGYPVPVVPQRSPMLDKSESFHRDRDKPSVQRGTPTTTQGTVMAQVTPQAQRGPSIGPFTTRQSSAFAERERNIVGSSPNLKNSETSSPSQTRASIHSKPVAMVPPHKIQGIKVLPTQHSLPKQSNVSSEGNSSPRQDLGMSRSKSPDMISRPSSIFTHESVGSPMRKAKSQYFPESKKIESSPSPMGDIYAIPRKGSQKKNKHKSKTESSPKWQSHKSMSSLDSGVHTAESEAPHNENLLVKQKKDAEIASVVQNIHFDYDGTMSPHAPHRTNFEKSLGYFP